MFYSLNELEAANLIGVCTATLRKWRYKEFLPKYTYQCLEHPSGKRSRIRYCSELLVNWHEAAMIGEAAILDAEVEAFKKLAA